MAGGRDGAGVATPCSTGTFDGDTEGEPTPQEVRNRKRAKYGRRDFIWIEDVLNC
jgi:hypothetical protein